VTKHVAVAMSDDEEGGEGGTVLLREWLYKNFLHPYPVRRLSSPLFSHDALRALDHRWLNGGVVLEASWRSPHLVFLSPTRLNGWTSISPACA
jgi:hypothetical protein